MLWALLDSAACVQVGPWAAASSARGLPSGDARWWAPFWVCHAGRQLGQHGVSLQSVTSVHCSKHWRVPECRGQHRLTPKESSTCED